MMSCAVDEISTESMKIMTSCSDNILEIDFFGEFTLDFPFMKLEVFFSRMHEECINNKLKNVNISSKDRHFINSESVKLLKKWIEKIMALEDHKKYTLTLFIHSSSAWQQINFSTLKSLSPGIVKVYEML